MVLEKLIKNERKMLILKIKDIMTEQVAFVEPESSVTQAAQLMQRHDVGVIPVCQNQNIVGMVTDRDIVIRNIASGKDPQNTPVKDIMTSNVKSINANMSLDQAAEIMSSNQVRRLPVVDNNQMVGIVALGDLAAQGRNDMEVADTLEEISEPAKPKNLKRK